MSSESSNNTTWAIIILVAAGLFFGIGPFGHSKCSSDNHKTQYINTNYSSPTNQWNGSFTGRSEDRLETGVNNTSTSKGSTCIITRKSLEKEGYTYCPKCGDPLRYHRN